MPRGRNMRRSFFGQTSFAPRFMPRRVEADVLVLHPRFCSGAVTERTFRLRQLGACCYGGAGNFVVGRGVSLCPLPCLPSLPFLLLPHSHVKPMWYLISVETSSAPRCPDPFYHRISQMFRSVHLNWFIGINILTYVLTFMGSHL